METIKSTETLNALKQAKEALAHLATAWMECQDAFNLIYFPEEVIESYEYPFEQSFTDYNILPWISEATKEINENIEEIEESLKPVDKDKVLELLKEYDTDAFYYLLPFCKGELRQLCKRLIYLSDFCQMSDGDDSDMDDEYIAGKQRLLDHFGIDINQVINDNPDGKMELPFE